MTGFYDEGGGDQQARDLTAVRAASALDIRTLGNFIHGACSFIQPYRYVYSDLPVVQEAPMRWSLALASLSFLRMILFSPVPRLRHVLTYTHGLWCR